MAERALKVSCQCPIIHESAYTPGSEQSPTMAVLAAIAQTEGVDITDLPPLYEAVDPTVIDRLFENGADEDTVVGFPYEDWNVFVFADGRIHICDATESG